MDLSLPPLLTIQTLIPELARQFPSIAEVLLEEAQEKGQTDI